MKKVFIARDEDGECFIHENRPERIPGGYSASPGIIKEFDPKVAKILGIPFPKPGEMIEWPPPAQTAAPEPEPPAETLVPITDLAQLKVGDKVENTTLRTHIMAMCGELVCLDTGSDPQWINLHWLREFGYQQVVTAPRRLSRAEARKAIDKGKTVRSVDGDVWYSLTNEKENIISGVAITMESDIPEGRYEIVGGE